MIQRHDNFKFFTNVDNDIYNIIGINGSSNSGLRVLLINHYLFGGHYSITLSGEIPVAQLGGAFTF